MNTSLFKNSRAMLGGVLAAIVIFIAIQAFFAIRGPQYAAPSSDPGTITVRPIVKDTATKDMTMSVMVALAGGFIAARAIHRRRARS